MLSNPSITAWAYNFLQAGSLIFLLPLLLRNFTNVEVSFWLLLGTITGFAMLADLGFSNTLIRCVSMFKAGANELADSISSYQFSHEVNTEVNFSGLLGLLKTIRQVYYIINSACFVLIILFGSAICYNLFSLTDDRFNLLLAFSITCIYSTVIVATSMWTSYAQGLDLIYKINLVKIITGSSKLLLLILLLILDSKLWVLSLILLAEAVINYIYAKRIVFQFFKKSGIDHDLREYKYDPAIFNFLWKPTWRMAGIKVGGYLINQGNTIVIAQIPNPSVIASFLFTKRILDFLATISLVPFNVNINNIYTSFVKNRNLEFRRYISTILTLVLAIFLGGAVFVGYLGNFLLGIVQIDSLILDNPAFALLALTMILELHHAMHAGIYMASNRVPFLLPAIISGMLILMLGFTFVSKVDLLGLIIIQFIVQLSLNNWYPVYLSLDLIKWPFFNYIRLMPVYGIRGLRTFFRKQEAHK